MGDVGLDACTMWSHFAPLNLGRTWRTTKQLAGAYSNISLTSSLSLLNSPPQSDKPFFRFVPWRLTAQMIG
jgi:hypothetical protein